MDITIKLTCRELRELCRSAGVKGLYKMRKRELLDVYQRSCSTLFSLLPIEIVEIVALWGGIDTLQALSKVDIRLRARMENPYVRISHKRILGCRSLHSKCELSGELCCWCGDKRTAHLIINELVYVDGKGEINPSQHDLQPDNEVNMNYCPTCSCK